MSVRQERLALADARALEKQGERQNQISEVRGGGVVGAGYTDIGKKAIALHRAEHRMLGSASGGISGGASGGVSGNGLLSDLAGMFGLGKGKHKKGSEAHYQGFALGKHLKKLHGGAFHHDFVEGMMGSGVYDTDSDSDREEANDSQHWVNGSGRDKHPETNPVGYGVSGGINTGAYEGEGVISDVLGMFGLGKKGKRGGRSGGRSGGAKRHNARAEVVRKVMKEKGMKMIEASKYVKEHGLY